MRDYQNIERYLNEFSEQIYEQPPDDKHTEWAKWVIDHWVSVLVGCKNVLDVGCGQGFCKPLFERFGIAWTGVTLGYDAVVCQDANLPVLNEDFSFLSAKNESYDLIFSRHSLEHSPMPLLTLMEWYRVSKQWLCVIFPNPEFWTVKGKNHYSVMYKDQSLHILETAGWRVIWENISKEEYRFMCEKIRK